jgi:DNA-binding NtrC family response regulator
MRDVAVDDLDRGATEQLAPRTLAPRRLRLVVIAGPDRGRAWPLLPGRHRVGKSRTCTLCLGDGAVSAQHLELEVGPGGVVVTDLDSTNGSWFAGARFTTLEVEGAATLTIGKSELRIEPVDAHAELEPSPAERFGGLLGRATIMRRLFTLLGRAGAADVSVLIEGETGTGKELAARALHEASPRRGGPFVVCDLATLSASLCESELFGHVRGAFTGAERDRIGAFEAAHGGTIFLDEVGELPLELQPRLLRALESREIRRLGETSYRPVDARVVAATHRDLRSDARQGSFREDLYHRLSVVTARLPSLRERAEDIPLLVERFVTGLGGDAAAIAPATMSALAAYDWPGNVRELRNVIERAVALGLELSSALFGVTGAVTGDRVAPVALAIDPSIPFHDAKSALVEAWERDYVTALLASSDGNVSLAARRAGMDRAYLHRLLKKHGG